MPPLSALRAFEAAARRLSFKEAADELSVTPGAISQQIRALEADLDVKLFDRGVRTVSLTAAGRALLPDLTEGFMKIRDAVDGVRPGSAPSLTVRAAGMIMRHWLLPRFHTFTSANGALETHLKTLYSFDDLSLGADEVVIRLAAEPPSGVYARPIHKLFLIPLASADFISQHALSAASDVLRVPLLEDAVIQLFEEGPGWEKWFKAADIADDVPEYAMKFDPYTAEYGFDMAVSGKGLLLGWSIQCADAIQAGELVCPFGPVLDLNLTYYVMCASASAQKKQVVAFMDWAEQAAAPLSALRAAVPGSGCGRVVPLPMRKS